MARTRRLPRWGDLSQVQRASLYLRSSLYLLLWAVPVVGVVALGGRVDAAYTGLAAVLLALTAAAGTAVLGEAIRLYPAPGPLPWRSLATLALVVGAVALLARFVTDEVGSPLVLLAVLTVALTAGGLTDRRVTAVLVASFVVVPLVATGSMLGTGFVVGYGLFLLFTVRSSLWLHHVVAELDRARTATSALAVAEERLRFSRDVHDVLGRHLSTIAVQAELAATLARRDDDRAVEQMLTVREGAHVALREARELARGYRETDLDTELDGARSLLASAGIGLTVDIDELPARWREPAAWVVREAVTNVLRHSRARAVWVRGDVEELQVADDGGGPTTDGRSGGEGGSGLRGLAERLEPLGATLGAGPDGDGFAVTMTVGGQT